MLWWSKNAQLHKPLAALSVSTLSIPPTSVASERLFSLAGNIHSARRNRLHCKRVEMLSFLKFNLSAFGFPNSD
jgi:hypothetical protein